MKTLLSIVVMLLLVPCAASAQTAEELVKVELVSSVKAIEPGKPFDIAVRYKIAPEWHLYWINPGDSGLPPTLKWSLPDGFSAGEARFPVPKRFTSEGDVTSFGYSDELVLLVTVTPPATLPETSKLSLETSFLVCKETCIPGKATTGVVLITAKEAKADPAAFAVWNAKLPVQTHARTTFEVRQNAGQIHEVSMTFEITLPQNTKDPEFFPGPSDTLSIKATKMDDSGEVQLSVVPLNKTSKIDETIMGVLAYTDSAGARRGLELKSRLQVDASK